MKTTPIRSVLLLTLIIIGCKDARRLEKNTQASDKITLIIRNATNNRWHINEDGSYSGIGAGEISWLDDNLLDFDWRPEKYPANDTLVIQTTRKIFEVKHKYKGLDLFYYLFQPGDSVAFSYPGGMPFAKILNREVSEIELNYEFYKRKNITNGNSPAALRLFTSLLIDSASRRRLLDTAATEQKRENQYLDSLVREKTISVRVSDYYKLHSKVNKAMAKKMLREEKLSAALLYDAEKDQSIDIERYMHENGRNDSLSYYDYHERIISDFIRNRARRFGKRRITANSNMFDPRITYDSLRFDNTIGGKAKKYALYRTLEELFIGATGKEKVAYFNKFQTDVNDSILISSIRRRYHIESSVNRSLILKPFSGKKITLDQVIADSKGKFVYVDFWATWCAPCMNEIPESKKLREEFKTNDIRFVYLSWDTDSVKWREGVKKTGQSAADTYLMINGHSSKVLDDLNLESIPRYLIYNGQGILINQDAPRPGTNEIRNVLKGLPGR